MYKVIGIRLVLYNFDVLQCGGQVAGRDGRGAGSMPAAAQMFVLGLCVVVSWYT